MSRKQSLLGMYLAVATAVALGASAMAQADDSSMNPFAGDFYRELHAGQNLGNPTPAGAAHARAEGTIAECAQPDDQKIAQAKRFLVLTPTPIFSDKGA